MKNLKSRHYFLTIFITCFLAFLSSCDTNNSRGLASVSQTEIKQLEYQLAVDRLHYWITELTEFKKGKVSEKTIQALKGLTPEKIKSLGLTHAQIKNPQNYDNLVYKLVKETNPAVKKADVAWGYNFLKNKLADSFVIDSFERQNDIGSDKIGIAEKQQAELEPKVLRVEDQTLEAEHYISNRTTRGVFWEALDSNRTMEFHLSDPREFKQNVGFRGGEIIGEVKTVSSNYNKIFLVKYPEEDTFRVAITNIGGIDRLEHLVSSLSLSRPGVKSISNKVEIFGDIEGFHRSIQKRLENMLSHLPKADRLVIGQKATIETFFYIYWKLLALRNLYEAEPDFLKSKITEKEFNKLLPLFENPGQFDIGKDKSAIEKAFKPVKTKMEKDYPDLLPERFKKFEFDNFVTSISDIEFTDASGKPVRWRLAANVWGDEISPIAAAFKNTGHDKVTYAGTAGALPGRGFNVGDFVIPSHIRLEEGYGKITNVEFGVEGAKTEARLGHVGSVFDETKDWLEKSLDDGIDLVEIEGKYLARVYGLENISLYLMVSDVLNSEGETLAQASSSKRKAMLQKFLHTVTGLDSKGQIGAPKNPMNNLEKTRAIVDAALGNKGDVYKHMIVSHFLDEKKVPTEAQVLRYAEEFPAFSDNYFHTRLSSSSALLTRFYREFEGDVPPLGISRGFLDGEFNPKNQKLVIRLLAGGEFQEEQINEALAKYSDELDEVSDVIDLKVVKKFSASDDLAQVAPPNKLDSDFLFKMFSHFSLRKTGLDYQITNAANVTFKFLPTELSVDPCDASVKNFCSLSYFSPSKMVQKLRDGFKKLFQGQDVKAYFEERLNDINYEIKSKGNEESFAAVVEKKMVNSLPNGKEAQIIPRFDNKKGLVIEVQFTKAGWARPEVVLEELGHLQQIVADENGMFGHPLYWAAVTLDAQKGSKRAKEVLADAESDVLERIRSLALDLGVEGEELDKYLDARSKQVDDLRKAVRKEVKAENKMRKSLGDQWKAVQSKLEKESLKLDDYIAKNDRKKVKELIETFLPWEQMEPTEVNAWRNWLAAIGKKNSSFKDSEKFVFFRGLSDDLIRDSDDGGHFLFSSMLQKNQGNYTRRLRSLKTYRDKLAKQVNSYDNTPFLTTNIVNSLKGHSHDPVGSPFISVSHARTASNFSDGKIVAMHIPFARTVDNLVSDYGETERLIPLIIFPDEILFINDSSSAEEARTLASQAIGRPLKDFEKAGSGKVDPLQATKQYWDYISSAPSNAPKGGSCSDMMMKVLGL